MYRVQFRHERGPTLSRAVFEIRYPGCVQAVEVPDSSGYGDITINNPLTPRIEVTEVPDSEILGCTAQIVTEDIHTHEGYTIEFVIDHEFKRCDLLSGYNPNREFFVDYEWEENGLKIDRRYVGEIQGADNAFREITLPPNSTKMTQQEDYSAYIYAAGDGGPNDAMSTCYP